MASGSVSKRPRGAWRVRWREYPGGPERAREFTRKVDAERFLSLTLADLERGEYVDPRAGVVTFRERAEEWRARQVHRESTAKLVENRLRLHIYPAFGDRPIASIRKSDIQSLVKQLEHRLAPSTVATTYSYAAAVFREAVEDRVLAYSPCVGINLPRENRRQLEPLTTEQVQAAIEAAPARYWALLICAAGTGLRQGEVCGLTVDRVDFLRRRITVDRQRNPERGSSELFAPPKTPASNRVVPLPDVVGEALAAHLAEYGPGPEGLVFTSATGIEVHRNVIVGAWNRIRAAGIVPPWATFHDLRHYYASLLIHAGESVKVVQARLGHATAAETLDTYAHLWPDSDDGTRAAVDSVLGSIADLSRTSGTG